MTRCPTPNRCAVPSLMHSVQAKVTDRGVVLAWPFVVVIDLYRREIARHRR